MQAIWTCFHHIECFVGDARMVECHLLGITNIRLAHLNEAPTVSQEIERRVDELTGETVKYNIHPPPVCLLEDVLLEIERP